MPLEGFNALPNFICFNNAISGGTNLALSRLVPRSAGLEGKCDVLTVVTIAIPYHGVTGSGHDKQACGVPVDINRCDGAVVGPHIILRGHFDAVDARDGMRGKEDQRGKREYLLIDVDGNG
eukprot:scaffold161938_cov44-Attheya_sp.AAC.1